MDKSNPFLTKILDSITEHIVVIDISGDIQYVNRSWVAFGQNNACSLGDDWHGVNYIEACDKAARTGDHFGQQAAAGIRSVIDQEREQFYFEYPCHSPEEKRWFMMRVTPFKSEGQYYFVISHQNITERKEAEEAVNHMARIDGLTDIANRRAFDEVLQEEYRRCARLKKPLAVGLLDIDHFKLLNDCYGHLSGDNCLKQIARLFKGFVNRPGDLCARYGGEEFALLWTETSLQQAEQLSRQILQQIVELQIPNDRSPTLQYVTASMGLVSRTPHHQVPVDNLIHDADNLLYQAKKNGRNRLELES